MLHCYHKETSSSRSTDPFAFTECPPTKRFKTLLIIFRSASYPSRRIFSEFSGEILVASLPDRLSSYTDVLPLLICPYHLNNSLSSIATSPQTCPSMLNVSAKFYSSYLLQLSAHDKSRRLLLHVISKAQISQLPK